MYRVEQIFQQPIILGWSTSTPQQNSASKHAKISINTHVYYSYKNAMSGIKEDTETYCPKGLNIAFSMMKIISLNICLLENILFLFGRRFTIKRNCGVLFCFCFVCIVSYSERIKAPESWGQKITKYLEIYRK